jgi:hypothetical protein
MNHGHCDMIIYIPADSPEPLDRTSINLMCPESQEGHKRLAKTYTDLNIEGHEEYHLLR